MTQNARIIEKSLLDDLTSTESGSETVDLNGASNMSCQAIYDVSAPSAKTFDSGKLALLALQDLTYTAVTRGTAGNSITIQYIGDGIAGAETVVVTTTNIVVHMDPTVVIGSTATQIRTAVLASGPAAALVTVAVTGTGSNVQAVVAATPLATGADPEVNITDNTVTIPSHGYPLGFKVQLTSTGTLPAGLATATDYFVIVVDANTIKFASSLANALLGTAVDITNQGSNGAVNTVTGVAISTTVTFQKSNNGSDWLNVQAATTITVDGSVMLTQSNVAYRHFKIVKTVTAGVVDLTALALVIGDGEMSNFARIVEETLAIDEVPTSEFGASTAVSLERADKYSIQVKATIGDSIAHRQASNDGTNWAEIDDQSVAEGDTVMFEEPDVGYRYVRINLENDDAVDVSAECYVLVVGSSM